MYAVKHQSGHIFWSHISFNPDADNLLVHLVNRLTKVVHSLRNFYITSSYVPIVVGKSNRVSIIIPTPLS